jgi:hypothetical protein
MNHPHFPPLSLPSLPNDCPRGKASGDLPDTAPDRRGSALPSPWKNAPRNELRSRVRRLPVVGDGTCADGAIVQAIEQSDFLDSLSLSQSLLRARASSKDAFREHEVGAAVAAWTEDDWTDKMPGYFRDEEWTERCRDQAAASVSSPDHEKAERTPARELAFFRRVLSLPSYAVGGAYLHAAAGVLQQGILLLSVDRRLSPVVHRLDDFGTQQYASSIILLLTVGPLKPGSRGDGHYETVCLLPPDDSPVHTVFEMNHPLLSDLRQWAKVHADARTLEHERVHELSYYPAISVRSGHRLRRPLPSGTRRPRVEERPHDLAANLFFRLAYVTHPRNGMVASRDQRRPCSRRCPLPGRPPLLLGRHRLGFERSIPRNVPRRSW